MKHLDDLTPNQVEELRRKNAEIMERHRSILGEFRPHLRKKTTTYGQKGGDGPNRGKKISQYEAIAPDGSRLVKRSYRVHTDVAILMAYQHNQVWYAGSIQDEVKDWNNQIGLSARKIK